MKSRKKIKILVKSMFKNSLSNGQVDSKKVQDIIREIISKKPANPVKILKSYKRLLSSALTKEEIVVESAEKITGSGQFEEKLLKQTGAKQVSYKTNPKIIFGAKITHGDWIWDATLQAKLERLTINN